MSNSMDFEAYQEQAWKFAKPTAKTTQYLLPGLAGEVGELCSLFAKSTRDSTIMDYKLLEKELGDILWFVSSLAFFHGISLADVARTNINKLESRQQRGTIGGSGDDR